MVFLEPSSTASSSTSPRIERPYCFLSRGSGALPGRKPGSRTVLASRASRALHPALDLAGRERDLEFPLQPLGRNLGDLHRSRLDWPPAHLRSGHRSIDLPLAWCGRRDSNSHSSRHRNLNPACLPIPPRPRTAARTEGQPPPGWRWAIAQPAARPRAGAAGWRGSVGDGDVIGDEGTPEPIGRSGPAVVSRLVWSSSSALSSAPSMTTKAEMIEPEQGDDHGTERAVGRYRRRRSWRHRTRTGTRPAARARPPPPSLGSPSANAPRAVTGRTGRARTGPERRSPAAKGRTASNT